MHFYCAHLKLRIGMSVYEAENKASVQTFVKIWNNWESIKLNHSQLPHIFVFVQAITLHL